MIEQTNERYLAIINIYENKSIIFKTDKDRRSNLTRNHQNHSRRTFTMSQRSEAIEWVKEKNVGKGITIEYLGDEIHITHIKEEQLFINKKEEKPLICEVEKSKTVGDIEIEFNEVIGSLSTLKENFNDIEENCYQLSKQLSKLDRTVNDLEHIMEFSNYNVVDGYYAYKEMRMVLTKRRKIKDMLKLYSSISKIDYNVIERIMGNYNSLENRQYKMKELDITNLGNIRCINQ